MVSAEPSVENAESRVLLLSSSVCREAAEYREFLYLIENAAIHDCAWLFDMPAAQKYTPSLVKKVKTANLSLCHIVNVVEHQTRKQ